MLIYAKSALKEKDLDVKLDIGCDGIEIQLLDELVNGEIGNYNLAEDVFELNKFKKYPVRVIHAPLLWNFGLPDVNIESFVGRDFKLLDQVCYIADYFGKQQGRDVIVVIHSEMNVETMRALSILDRITYSLDKLFSKYHNIEIVFENVTPLRKVYKSEVSLCNNFSFDNIELVGYLRRELNSDKLGTCLDTCHALITDRYMSAIYDKLEDVKRMDYSLNSYFEKNRNYVKLMHISDAKGNGYGKGKHGAKFSNDNRKRLVELMELYDKYGYTCPVTLEIDEVNYQICNGYRESRNTLLSVLSNKEESIKSA